MYRWISLTTANLTNAKTDTVTVPNIATSRAGGLMCTVTDPMEQITQATIFLTVQGKCIFFLYVCNAVVRTTIDMFTVLFSPLATCSWLL